MLEDLLLVALIWPPLVFTTDRSKVMILVLIILSGFVVIICMLNSVYILPLLSPAV